MQCFQSFNTIRSIRNIIVFREKVTHNLTVHFDIIDYQNMLPGMDNRNII